MKSSDLRHARYLADKISAASHVIKALNEINRGEQISMPSDVFAFVDTQLAAKGLLSLVIETRVAMCEELEALGVEFDG